MRGIIGVTTVYVFTIILCGLQMGCGTVEPKKAINETTGCPTYTHKDDVTIGQRSNLPSGYFIYAHDYTSTKTGLFISKIGKYEPKVIPSTEKMKPSNLSISDDGNWILFAWGTSAYLVKRDGSRNVFVPTKGIINSVTFYRNGPSGTEICYTSSDIKKPVIHALQVTLGDSAVFGTDRIIADLSDKFRIEKYYPISVAHDEILGAFSPVTKDSFSLRMGFLTIPDKGKGIAKPENMYKWKNDDNRMFWGCNSTLSHDGTIALYIAGAAGMTPDFIECLPTSHQGFVVTPFRRDTDPAVDINDHIDRYALSINWCPPEYRLGTEWDETDFRGWYLGNRNDYVIGDLAGTLAPVKGVWLVDWKRSIWTMLTPKDSVLSSVQPAVFFSDSFAVIDDGNPKYRVVSPNGGEVFTVSQQCTVKVTSEEYGNAVVRVLIGQYTFPLPGVTRSINPQVDSMFVFTIPDTFSIKSANLKVSSVSDSCRIGIFDYISATGFNDFSDSCFSIKAAP